ncbi:hypothetical protein DPMN_146846 [Dreissena polymorpha]|uniref:Uncharacterized protein n=1 Tax=Dreissena polymorpha TaxID=45954 RepID=A0A9D4J2G5_DREPO|nr:hypothetical protein DPMN_146846 [Dreissena polymorpha]
MPDSSLRFVRQQKRLLGCDRSMVPEPDVKVKSSVTREHLFQSYRGICCKATKYYYTEQPKHPTKRKRRGQNYGKPSRISRG